MSKLEAKLDPDSTVTTNSFYEGINNKLECGLFFFSVRRKASLSD